MNVEHVPTPVRSFLNFDIRVAPAEGGWESRVGLPGDTRVSASHRFELDFDRVVRPDVELLRERSTNRVNLERMGAELFQLLLGGEVGELFRSFQEAADNEGAVLRVRLHLGQATPLAAVPWEYLHEPEVSGDFLFTSTYMSLMRSPKLRKQKRPPVELPLRILVIAYCSPELAKIDIEGELKRIHESLDPLVVHKAVAVDVLSPPTLSELQKRLRRSEYHIVHFLGQGAFDEQAGDGVLYFEPEASQREAPQRKGQSLPGATSGRRLGTLLKDSKSLRLVILNACDGAKSGAGYYAGAAQSMVRVGVPAVIGMQSTITDDAAVTLAQAFYGALADGYAVDVALGEARKAIYTLVSDTEWGIPALFSQVQDGSILGLHIGRDGQTIEEPPNLEELRLQILRDWSDAHETVELAGATAVSTDEEGRPPLANEQESVAYGGESSEEDAAPPPPRVWFAVAPLDDVDWGKEFQRGGLVPLATLASDDDAPLPRDEQVVLLYNTAKDGDGLVGWGQYDSETKSIAPLVVWQYRLAREELRAVPGLARLQGEDADPRSFFEIDAESWSVLLELIAYFGNVIDARMPIPSVEARYAINDDPRIDVVEAVSPGESLSMTVFARNTGNRTWEENAQLAVSAVLQPAIGRRVELGQLLAAPFSAAVPPAGECEIAINHVIQAEPGSYRLELDVFGSAAMGSPYLGRARGSLYVGGRPAARIDDVAIPESIVAGKDFRVEVTLTNVGEVAWPVGERFKLDVWSDGELKAEGGYHVRIPVPPSESIQWMSSPFSVHSAPGQSSITVGAEQHPERWESPRQMDSTSVMIAVLPAGTIVSEESAGDASSSASSPGSGSSEPAETEPTAAASTGGSGTTGGSDAKGRSRTKGGSRASQEKVTRDASTIVDDTASPAAPRTAPPDLAVAVPPEQREWASTVQVNVFNNVMATVVNATDGFDALKSTTLDVHVHPSLSRRTTELITAGASNGAELKPALECTVLLSLYHMEAGGRQRRDLFEGPLVFDEEQLNRAGGRGDERYGATLFGALFTSETSDSEDRLLEGEPISAALAAGFQKARALAGEKPLRVQLRIDSSLVELHRHAWEYLLDSLTGLPEPLACSAQTPFARTLNVSAGNDLAELTISAAEPLRMLAVLASPAELADETTLFSSERGVLLGLSPVERMELDVLVERVEGLATLEPLAGDNVMSGEVTLEDLRRRLQDAEDQGRPYSVLHLFCHGVVDERGHGALVISRRDRALPSIVDERTFAEALRQAKGLRLVVLASCFTAKATQGHALRGVARRLVEAGVPAVVAMQDTLQYESGQHFSQRLYRQLLHSGEIDRAVNAARLELRYKSRAGSVVRRDEWGIPVLFTRIPDGRLFKVDDDTATDPEERTRSRPYSDSPGADPQRLVRQAMQEATSSLAGSVVIDLASLMGQAGGLVGAPATDFAEEAAPTGVFGRPGQEPTRAALVRAVLKHRRHGNRRTVLYLRELARGAVSNWAESLAAEGRSAAELGAAFRRDVAVGGQVRLGAKPLELGGAGPPVELLLDTDIGGWRDARRGWRSRGGDVDVADGERLTFDGNLWWDDPAPADGDWTAEIPALVRELLRPDADRFRVLEELVDANVSPDVNASSLSVLLHATDPVAFAPYQPALAEKVLDDALLGRGGAPDGREYVADYRGFNRLATDLASDPELGLEGVADAVLFLQRLAAGRFAFDPATSPLGRPPLAEVHLDAHRLDTQLVVPHAAIEQALAALDAGKHIILTGPPGTGKTTLAEDLCRLASDRHASRGHLLATATADWTTFDTIGGYALGADQRLAFQPGLFLRAIREERWLVIDEINRADIDKAFGELFTLLSGQAVTLPYRSGGRPVRILPEGELAGDEECDYLIPASWRIIGTMNVYDRASLFSMSKAFMRRFAFVEVDVPEPRIYQRLIGEFLGRARVGLAEGDDVRRVLTQLFEAGEDNHLMSHRSLGPAIALDVIRYLGSRRRKGAQLSLADVAAALSLYVVPQLDDLTAESAQEVYAYLAKKLPADGRELLRRISALFPYFSLEAPK